MVPLFGHGHFRFQIFSNYSFITQPIIWHYNIVSTLTASLNKQLKSNNTNNNKQPHFPIRQTTIRTQHRTAEISQWLQKRQWHSDACCLCGLLSTLYMEVACCSEMSVNLQRVTSRHISQNWGNMQRSCLAKRRKVPAVQEHALLGSNELYMKGDFRLQAAIIN
jgi:hypothetical protein